MAGTASVLINRRISLGGTEYLYTGTITPDTSYVTGGDTLTLASGSVVATLPERFHHMVITGGGSGLEAEFVGSGQKVKLFLGAESGSGLKGAKEATEGTDYSSAGALPFIAFAA